METICRFSACKWHGAVEELFEHVEEKHRECIREHKNLNYYDFVFEDITREAYFLSGKNGIYWFCLDMQNEADEASEMVKRGVFHIGESEPITYTVKLGLMRDGLAEYLGPFKSEYENEDRKADKYDLEFALPYIQYLNEEMPSRKMRLYIGDYDDSDDRYNPDCDEIEWDEEDELVNKICLERFKCSICFEYIRRDARYCERKHFICLNCFDELYKMKKLRCPFCRGDYAYDCHDDKLERLLRMVKFPDTNNDDEIGPSAKRFKTEENPKN